MDEQGKKWSSPKPHGMDGISTTVIRNVTANAQRPWFGASVNRRLIRMLAGGKNHRIKTEPARMSFLFFSSVISKLIWLYHTLCLHYYLHNVAVFRHRSVRILYHLIHTTGPLCPWIPTHFARIKVIFFQEYQSWCRISSVLFTFFLPFVLSSSPSSLNTDPPCVFKCYILSGISYIIAVIPQLCY